jgi:hypothetical protein
MPVPPNGPEPEPLSPELILVAPPDEAQAAREHLEDAPGSEWDEFLARVRARPEPPPDVDSTAEPAERPKRRSRRPLVVAGVAILVVSLAVGIAFVRDRAPQRAAQPPATAATATAATPSAGTTPPAPRKKPARKPTLVSPKRTHSTGVKPARTSKTAKPKVRTTRPTSAKRGAGFVPARIWSWPKGANSPHYLVRFFRNGHKVLAVRTARPRLVLPKRFTFRAGRYRWTVVPVSPRGKLGRALVDSTFVVSKAGR